MKTSEKIAKAIIDSGTKTFTFVPGFGGNEIYRDYCNTLNQNIPISFNEEVAYTISHGTSIVGKRSVTILKSHGFAKAANSVIDSMTAGCTAGFVIIISEDSSGSHSDNIFDIESILKAIRIPFVRSNPDIIYKQILDAFEYSEKTQLPFVIILDSATINDESPEEDNKKETVSIKYERDILKFAVSPVFAKYQHQILSAKLSNQSLADIDIPEIPIVPDSVREHWKPTVLQYQKFFDVFKSYRGNVVTGETGLSALFSFPPYNCIDIVTYMGGSIPLAIGASLAGFENIWAVTGDFAFIAAGHMGLIEITNRKLPIKIIIMKNNKASATGGQPINKNILENILSGYREYIIEIQNPQDGGEVESILKKLKPLNEFRIIIVNY